MNDLDSDLARNTPWVDMSACVKFRLDRPSRLAGHTEQTNRQTDRQTNKQTYRLLLYRLTVHHLRPRLASGEGIVTLLVTLSRCVCVRRISLGGEGMAFYTVLPSFLNLGARRKLFRGSLFTPSLTNTDFFCFVIFLHFLSISAVLIYPWWVS